MTGNVMLPVVSKEEFRRMLMFANRQKEWYGHGRPFLSFWEIFSKVFFHASWQDA